MEKLYYICNKFCLIAFSCQIYSREGKLWRRNVCASNWGSFTLYLNLTPYLGSIFTKTTYYYCGFNKEKYSYPAVNYTIVEWERPFRFSLTPVIEPLEVGETICTKLLCRQNSPNWKATFLTKLTGQPDVI